MAHHDSPPPWQVESSETEAEYEVYSVRLDRVRSPKTGKVLDYHVVVAVNGVAVIALTTDGELVMVEQYRHGVRELSLELPGGILDDDTPEDAARRELQEETGYEVDEVRTIGRVASNPAWETSQVHVVVATGAVATAEKDEDEGEDIRVRRIPVDQVRQLITAGEIRSAITIASLYLFEAQKGSVWSRPD